MTGSKPVKKTFVPKRDGHTLLLRLAILAMGLPIAAICLVVIPLSWHSIPDENHDLAYAIYAIVVSLLLAAIPFFYALYQAWLMLRYIDTGKAFSQLAVKALKHICISALVISGIFLAASPFYYKMADVDDAPGLLVLCLFVAGLSFAIALFAGVLQRLFREAIAIKSENDLTV